MSKIDRIVRRNKERRIQPRYTCKYISGGGVEYDGGIWRKQDRPQTITFVCVKEPFFDIAWHKLVIHKDPKKNKRHCLRDWQNGTYTIYPDQCGTPYIFKPFNLHDDRKGI